MGMGIHAAGAYIRTLREHHGLTMLAVATTAGVNPNYIWRVETGDIKQPSAENMAAVVRTVQGNFEQIAALLLDDQATAADGRRIAEEWIANGHPDQPTQPSTLHPDDQCDEAVQRLKRLETRMDDLMALLKQHLQIGQPAAPKARANKKSD